MRIYRERDEAAEPVPGKEELVHEVKSAGRAARTGGVGGREWWQTPTPKLFRSGICDPADAALVMHLGAVPVFVGFGNLRASLSIHGAYAAATRHGLLATTYYKRSAELSVKVSMSRTKPGLDISKLPESELMANA